MKDITYCTATECPSKECRIKVTNNHFTSDDLVSVADFSGVCRFYIGWVVSEVENDTSHVKSIFEKEKTPQILQECEV